MKEIHQIGSRADPKCSALDIAVSGLLVPCSILGVERYLSISGLEIEHGEFL